MGLERYCLHIRDGNSSSPYGYLSDLWRLEMSSMNWTWLKGPSDMNNCGVYGDLLVRSPSNNPGARDGIFFMDLQR